MLRERVLEADLLAVLQYDIGDGIERSCCNSLKSKMIGLAYTGRRMFISGDVRNNRNNK